MDAVEAVAARLTGRHGLATLEEAIDAHRRGSAGTRSEKEDAVHALLRGHMPKPIANVKVLGREVDADWPEFKLVAEIDGPGHARPRARRRDALRDRELRDAGYIFVRFTDVDVEQRPDEVLVTLLAARAGR